MRPDHGLVALKAAMFRHTVGAMGKPKPAATPVPGRPEDWRDQIKADLAAQLEAGGTLYGFRPDGTCTARTRVIRLTRPAGAFRHADAGPNGCGKSTLTRTTWFRGVEVVDPDAFTRDMTAGYPARAALKRRHAVLAAGRTLALETTLAGAGVLRFMETARQAGYRIVLHFVSVNSAETGWRRVVRCPGSGRATEVRPLARQPAAGDHAGVLYDNTGPGMPYREVVVLRGGSWWSAFRSGRPPAIARVTPQDP